MPRVGRGFVVHLQTNGTLLDRVAESLVAQNVEMVTVSMDGPQEVYEAIRGQKGAFEKTCAGLKALVAARDRQRSPGPIILINCVISKASLPTLDQMVLLGHELGADILQVQHTIFNTAGHVARHNRALSPEFAAREGLDLIPPSIPEGEYYESEITPADLPLLLNQLKQAQRLAQDRLKLIFLPTNRGMCSPSMVVLPRRGALCALSIQFVCCALLGLFLALTARAQERQDQASRLYAQFARGYEAIVTDPAEAISIFEQIVRAHSTNVIVRKQLGSLYIGAGRTEDALEQFRVVDILSPSDTTKLQIAYLLASLGRNGEAQLAFDELTTSSESRIREQASSASAVLAWVARSGAYPWWGRVSGDPYYDSRFNNTVFRFSLMGGAYLTESKMMSAYATGLFTRDTRSTGGAVPVVYSDSYFLVGGGLRLQPLPGATIDLQGGLAIDLIGKPEEPEARADVRALASYGWGLYPAGLLLPSDFE